MTKYCKNDKIRGCKLPIYYIVNMSKTSLKIAFIGQKGIPTRQGGIEKHVEELSTRLAKAGFAVTVYSRPHYTKNQAVKNYRGVKIVNLFSFNTKHLDAITHTLFASLHALSQNYDIIHYHGVGPSLLSFIPRIFAPQVKVIATFHCVDRKHQKWGAFARLMLTLGERAACRFPHQTITISEALQKYCEHKFDKQTIYIPNGVAIKSSKNKNQTLKKFALIKDGYFLTVSRLIKHKGIHTLIKAYQKIKTNKKLVIVGAGANTDDYVKQLKNLAGENKNIIFTGEQTGAGLENLFKNAYVFVQPSEAEGLSIALLEALAYGVPILVSDIEENLEAANGFGLIFKNKNIADLAKKLAYALKNKELIKARSVLARRQVSKKYNWNDITKKTAALYRETVNEKEPSKKRVWKLA